MNIKISKDNFEFIFYEIRQYDYLIGSKLYETDNETSDTDILVIYENFHEHLDKHYPNNHQFQYDDVENNIQYILTSEDQFKRNLFSGDSTINADLFMFNYSFYKNYTENDRLNVLRTYNIIKAYVGFAKRDLNFFNKGKNKAFHIERGLYCANCLMENILPDIEVVQYIFKNPKTKEELSELLIKSKDRLGKLFESGDLTFFPKNYLIEPKNEVEEILIKSNNIVNFHY